MTTLAGAAADVTGSAPLMEGVTYGADMRLLVNEGRIPTVLFGPGDVRVAHMPDESVSLGELRVAAETLVLAAVRLCGVADQAHGAVGAPSSQGGDPVLPPGYVLRHPTTDDMPAAQRVLDASEAAAVASRDSTSSTSLR